MAISEAARRVVWQRAEQRCEYCKAPAIIGIMMHIDHIEARVRGGSDEAGNLCLACNFCNSHKYTAQASPDPITGQIVSLFNPRTQTWSDHFTWDENSILIIGLTEIGRATIERLQLNTKEWQISRALWVKAGVHPPPENH